MTRFKRILPGIYEETATGNYYERPKVNGRRTWRKLEASSPRQASEVMAARRTDAARSKLGLAIDPYQPSSPTVGQLVESFASAEPDARLESRLRFILKWWREIRVSDIKAQQHWSAYLSWRTNKSQRGPGHRAAQLELSTLRAIFRDAVTSGRIPADPLSGLIQPRARPVVQHCRDFMPVSADELHATARHAFSQWKSAVLGWQILIQAYTGCRTSEAVRLRWDARPQGAGYITGDWLWLQRSKGGTNPFAQIHPALRETLDALKAWNQKKGSPWFFPSPIDPTRPVDTSSLSHWMVNIGSPLVGFKRTAHGLRAFYVTVRRSQGISDAQIAAEIGDATGASIIASTYGAVPPNWRGQEPMSWLPTKGDPPAYTTVYTTSSPL